MWPKRLLVDLANGLGFVPQWVPMSDSTLPKTWAEAGNPVLGNAHWIWLLLAGERAMDQHFYQAAAALLGCFASLGIAIHRNAFEGLGTRNGRRRVAFVVIIIGAVCLAVGIYLLAVEGPHVPLKPVAEETVNSGPSITQSSQYEGSPLGIKWSAAVLRRAVPDMGLPPSVALLISLGMRNNHSIIGGGRCNETTLD